jgi:hypothetical protein
LLGEQVEPKARGVRLSLLPPPWPKVAEFFKNYLTYEGRYHVVYQHEFVLLSHLRHARLVNIPYYLLGCLRNMSHYCRQVKNPILSLTHHRLVQLLIQKGFSQQNPLLNNPPINPQEAAEHLENPHEEQPQNLPDPLEIPINPPTDPIVPINPPTIPSPPHNLPESSTPTVHITSDDFQADKPDNPPYSITEEKTTHKRKKQTTTFPSFLPRRKMRASTKATTTATTLNPQPILLKSHTPPPYQILEFLPVLPTGTETQEPEAQGAATSFSLHQVVVTQESTTHSIAVTQEPATHSVVVTQEPAIVVTQEPATTETQEPAVDFVPEIQESDAQGAATLFYLHQVAKTQESTADFVAARTIY